MKTATLILIAGLTARLPSALVNFGLVPPQLAASRWRAASTACRACSRTACTVPSSTLALLALGGWLSLWLPRGPAA